MKKIISIIIISYFLVNCKNNTVKDSLDSSNINEIVEAIIIQDSLNVLKNEKGSDIFCADLVKVKILHAEKNKKESVPLPPSNDFVLLDELINTKINGKLFFTNNDSITLLMQNSNPQKIRICNEIFYKINSTTSEKLKERRNKNNRPFSFYEMSIPLFSLDREKAYVQIGHYCGRLCGSGKAIYLKKINGKWKIIDIRSTWIS